MNTPITCTQMEGFARCLNTVRLNNNLSPELVNVLHAGFQATDTAGTIWTVGLQDGQWHRLEQSQWVADNSPQEVTLSDSIVLALRVVEELTPQSQEKKPEIPAGEQVSREKMEGFARALDAAGTNGQLSAELFNGMHARYRGQDANGNVWTVGIKSLDWHRLHENQWVAGDPPGSVVVDKDLIIALEALGPVAIQPSQPAAPEPEPSPPTCEACGNLIKPGKQFCTVCGAPFAPTTPSITSERYCPNPGCGRVIPEGYKFCTGCGVQIE